MDKYTILAKIRNDSEDKVNKLPVLKDLYNFILTSKLPTVYVVEWTDGLCGAYYFVAENKKKCCDFLQITESEYDYYHNEIAPMRTNLYGYSYVGWKIRRLDAFAQLEWYIRDLKNTIATSAKQVNRLNERLKELNDVEIAAEARTKHIVKCEYDYLINMINERREVKGY